MSKSCMRAIVLIMYITITRNIFLMCTISVVFSFPVYSEIVYKLKKDETIYQISERYNIPIKILLSSNAINAPSNLPIGKKIVIPDPINNNLTESQKTKTIISYKVKKGDTLYSIAGEYNADVEEIMQINKIIDPSNIKFGKAIKIPTFLKDNKEKQYLISSLPKKPSNTTSTKSENTVFKKKPLQSSSLLKIAKPIGFVSDKWPVSGNSYELNGNLSGILIESNENTDVRAISSGTVLYAAGHTAFSKIVVIQNKNGELYVYGGQKTLFVKSGDKISEGDIIGTLGIMPLVKRPVLYFSIWKKDKFINPRNVVG